MRVEDKVEYGVDGDAEHIFYVYLQNPLDPDQVCAAIFGMADEKAGCPTGQTRAGMHHFEPALKENLRRSACGTAISAPADRRRG